MNYSTGTAIGIVAILVGLNACTPKADVIVIVDDHGVRTMGAVTATFAGGTPHVDEASIWDCENIVAFKVDATVQDHLLRDVVGKKGNVYVLEEKVKDGDGKRWCITQRGEPRHLKSIGTVNIADSDEEIGRRFLRRPSK